MRTRLNATIRISSDRQEQSAVRQSRLLRGGMRAIWQGFLCLLLGLSLPGTALAIQINRLSSTNLFTDFVNLAECNYAHYQITNNDAVAYTNLWVTIGGFSGSIVKLGGGDPGRFNLGKLGINEAKSVFFYLDGSSLTSTNQTHTVSVYRGFPATGTLLTNTSFGLQVINMNRNNANKLDSMSVTPGQPIVGASVVITVDGKAGTLKLGDPMNFFPASLTNWTASAFELTGLNVRITNGASVYYFTNQMSFPAPAALNGSGAGGYHATYFLRAIASTATAIPISPDGCFGTGNNSTLEHSVLASGLLIPQIAPPTNATVLAKFVNVSQLYTNETATYTFRFTNSSTDDITLDRIVDTLPAGLSYVANSSFFDGVAVAGPNISGQSSTWSETYSVPGGTSRDFVFNATGTAAGFVTNSVIAFTKDTQLDTTLVTTDSVPATATVRVLLEPRAANDVATLNEDTPLTLGAPGVLANDNEPNGFSISVVSYTQPAHGTVSVSADGSYLYAPAADYHGPDSFSYTFTNGNARASSGTVNLTVTAVNDPPTLNPIGNMGINENAGQQTVNLTGISAGPSDEAGQSLIITAFSSNPALIPNPVVTYTSPNASGTLSFTATANEFGSSTITVIVQDNGGTANGGIDSVTNTFVVGVGPVNLPPTLDPISDPIINEDPGLQTINLTGIAPGPPNESTQSVTITATSSDPSIIANPTVNYTNPNGTGTLTFTPVTNAFGTCTITVVVHDNGGTANGGVDSATNTFLVTVNPVNDPPTLDPLNEIVITEGSGLQTVLLTGISAGPANETGQTITITAVSSDPSLFLDPSVTYLSPDANGSLTFTPLTNAFGTSIVSVIVHDSGGSFNGGSDTITNTFTVVIQAVTNIWAPDGNFTWNVSDASGPAGTGFTQTNYVGILDVQATSSNPFTINLVSLDGSTPGTAANFDRDTNYTWTIATTGRGVIDFDTNKFVVDTSQFTNDLGGGEFLVTLSADGSSVNIIFTNNHPPLAAPATYGRAWGTSLRIPLNDLMSNYTSDSDGDGRALETLGLSTNGSPVFTRSAFILFAPTNNQPESFTYVVRDLRSYRPGDSIRTATNYVTVSVTNAVSSAQGIDASGGQGVQLRFAGVPGYAYDIERADNPAGPWIPIGTTNAPPGGVWLFQDPSPPQPTAFYRTRQH